MQTERDVPQALWSIISGLALALLSAVAIAVVTGVPADVLGLVEFALPGAVLAIVLAEARRVRGIVYWVLIGFLIGVAGWIALPDSQAVTHEIVRFSMIAAMGLLAGYIYYVRAGRRSGYLAAALQRRFGDHA